MLSKVQRKDPAMTFSSQESRQSFLSFLAAIPAAAIAVWATYGLANFIV